MRIKDRMGMIWAIARKDIVEALKNQVMVSVMLGVIVLVGSSQIGVLLQQASETHIVYVYDITGINIAYSVNIPEAIRLIVVDSDEGLNQALVNHPGPAVGLSLVTNSTDLTVDVAYAHWVDRNTVNVMMDIWVGHNRGTTILVLCPFHPIA